MTEINTLFILKISKLQLYPTYNSKLFDFDIFEITYLNLETFVFSSSIEFCF